MTRFGFTWPQLLNCNKFPVAGTGTMCVYAGKNETKGTSLGARPGTNLNKPHSTGIFFSF